LCQQLLIRPWPIVDDLDISLRIVNIVVACSLAQLGLVIDEVLLANPSVIRDLPSPVRDPIRAGKVA
jgi:hypothetical protein